MLYLASPVRPEVYPLARGGQIGILFQPAYRPRPYHYLDEITWAADNGCFAKGNRFDLSRYLAFLDAYAEHAPTCVFATAPDVMGNASATWAKSEPVLASIRQRGYHAALVAQDGFDEHAVDWSAFDALFVGGSTHWKLGPGLELARVAKRHGKHAHLGRVNSSRRFEAARWAGFDTADGTFLAYSPDRNASRLKKWIARADTYLQLPLQAAHGETL